MLDFIVGQPISAELQEYIPESTTTAIAETSHELTIFFAVDGITDEIMHAFYDEFTMCVAAVEEVPFVTINFNGLLGVNIAINEVGFKKAVNCNIALIDANTKNLEALRVVGADETFMAHLIHACDNQPFAADAFFMQAHTVQTQYTPQEIMTMGYSLHVDKVSGQN